MVNTKRYNLSRRGKSMRDNKTARNKKRSNRNNGISKKTKQIRRNKTHKRRRHNIRSNKMKGGNNTLKPVPFVPPGGGYKVGNTNGLGSGYYYNLAQPEIHAPNGTAKTSNDINVNGKPLSGGRRQRKNKSKKLYKRMRGGGIIPNDIVYLYRSAGSSLGNLYKGLMGQEIKPNTNPNPMYQPEMVKPVKLDSSVVDVNNIINKAQHEASL